MIQLAIQGKDIVILEFLDWEKYMGWCTNEYKLYQAHGYKLLQVQGTLQ